MDIQYVDDAPEECQNGTDPFQIYVILARRIQAASNTTVTSADLVGALSLSLSRSLSLSLFLPLCFKIQANYKIVDGCIL